MKLHCNKKSADSIVQDKLREFSNRDSVSLDEIDEELERLFKLYYGDEAVAKDN